MSSSIRCGPGGSPPGPRYVRPALLAGLRYLRAERVDHLLHLRRRLADGNEAERALDFLGLDDLVLARLDEVAAYAAHAVRILRDQLGHALHRGQGLDVVAVLGAAEHDLL